MNCKKCCHPIEEGSGFCSGCGASIETGNETLLIQEDAHGETESLFEHTESANAESTARSSTFEQSVNINGKLVLKMKQKNKMLKLPIVMTIVLILVIGGAAAAVFGVSALNTKKYDELSDTGNKYLEELKYEEAVETYLEAIDIKPKREEAYIGAAMGYIGLDEPEKAKDILEQGLEKIKKPSDKFTDLCDELGVKYEVSGSESTSIVSQKPITADDLEGISKYLSGSKGSDQIDWDNITPDLAGYLFSASLTYSGMPFILNAGGTDDYPDLQKLVQEKYHLNLNGVYKLDVVNKNIKSLFGDKSRTLSKNDFPGFDGSDSFRTREEDIGIYEVYYPKLDSILVICESFGWGEDYRDFDYIVECIQQGDTILAKRRFYTVYWEAYDTIPYMVPDGFNSETAAFSEKQEVAKNYYEAAISVGVDVNEYNIEYTLAYNADGTLYLKSVNTSPLTTNENVVTQTTDSIFGRSISTVYLVKTPAGGPVNLRSGPGLDFAPITTLLNSTVVTGQALSKDEQWVYVSAQGTSGWVSLAFLMVYS